MRRIRICGAAEACVDLQASLRVALHVTKRQTGANASHRGRVSGGISGNQASHEAHCKAFAGRALMRVGSGKATPTRKPANDYKRVPPSSLQSRP